MPGPTTTLFTSRQSLPTLPAPKPPSPPPQSQKLLLTILRDKLATSSSRLRLVLSQPRTQQASATSGN
ncbi:hypothetical protein H9L39_11340 [Fusarium oxysporum f. sp. albedinis]|nr:hypothetical protein FOMA001_g11565 [Fusarium oxysporum f. sp. matthiolae]KAK2476116.1 hypothetical protein H9L39_11340 [Fusarium oxysporum f. sp. albedinis]